VVMWMWGGERVRRRWIEPYAGVTLRLTGPLAGGGGGRVCRM